VGGPATTADRAAAGIGHSQTSLEDQPASSQTMLDQNQTKSYDATPNGGSSRASIDVAILKRSLSGAGEASSGGGPVGVVPQRAAEADSNSPGQSGPEHDR
jgi:hypothetical protein